MLASRKNGENRRPENDGRIPDRTVVRHHKHAASFPGQTNLLAVDLSHDPNKNEEKLN